MGKPVEGDVEDMPAGPAEPGGQAAQTVVLFQQQHGVAGPGKRIGGRHSGQSRADNDDIVLIAGALEEVAWHGESERKDYFNKCALATVIPLRTEPTIPTKPWSVPQMKRFFRCVVPS